MRKILEAIQKGVQMGLEIQNDELDQPIFQRSLMTSDVHVQRADHLRWVRENFVDLELPSGTLWCKWNIGATNGDTPESWYGNYYAWGELKPKKYYRWKTYKHCNGMFNLLTKYNFDQNYGEVDNKRFLEPEDDVVNVTLENSFRMPTKEDFEELCTLPSEWDENHNGINGLNGRIFTGNNGNQLFIPAAGYWSWSYLHDVGSDCSLQSGSLDFDNPNYAYGIYFDSVVIDPLLSGDRCYGRSVRGVLK